MIQRRSTGKVLMWVRNIVPVFLSNQEEREIAQAVKVEAQRHWKEKIVTEILPAERFYDAEVYHQDYFKNRG